MTEVRRLFAFLWACALQAQPAWEVAVKTALPGPVLEVELRMAPGDDDACRINADCGAFVERVELEVDGVWKPAAWSGDEGRFPGAEARGLHLRYRFRLGEAAAALRRLMLITGKDEAFLVRPSAFLLRPRSFWPDRPARLAVTAPAGWSWLSGLPRGDTITEALDDAPYSALGRLERRMVAAGSAEVEVAWAFGGFPVPRAALFLWPTDRGRGRGSSPPCIGDTARGPKGWIWRPSGSGSA